MFAQAQEMLARGSRRRTAPQRRGAGAVLTGRIRDSEGQAMSPAFSYGRGGRVYRYYVTAKVQQGAAASRDGEVRRVSAPAIEALVTKAMERFHPAGDLAALKEVRLGRRGIALTLPASLRSHVLERLTGDEQLASGSTARTIVVTLPITAPLRGGAKGIAAGEKDAARPDMVLIGALRKAHGMLARTGGLPVMTAAPASPYERRILRLAFLAPTIQREILAGRQPPHCNLEYLMRQDIPLQWAAQPAALGWTR